MSGHTLTLVDDTKLCLIGGFSSSDYFSELVYEYDASDNSWTQMEVTGSTPTGEHTVAHISLAFEAYYCSFLLIFFSNDY